MNGKLYYIIEKDTNERALNHDGNAKIIDEYMCVDEIERQGWLRHFHKTVRIEIGEYNCKFNTGE